jgi:hypothetical protein
MQKQLASGVKFHAGQVWAETYLAQRSFLPPTLVAGNSLIGSLAASSSGRRRGSQTGSIQEGRLDATKIKGTSRRLTETLTRNFGSMARILNRNLDLSDECTARQAQEKQNKRLGASSSSSSSKNSCCDVDDDDDADDAEDDEVRQLNTAIELQSTSLGILFAKRRQLELKHLKRC